MPTPSNHSNNARGNGPAGANRPGGGRRTMRPRRGPRPERPKPEYDQEVLDVRRVARVMRGGKRFRFLIIMAIGNRRGKVGVGTGKGADISLAMEKAARDAKKHLVELKLTKGMSLPHELSAKHCSSRVIMRPARGRGLAAGSAVRTVLTLAGVQDVSAKIQSKSKNKLNNARAAMAALSQVRV
ncbi:MAG: 30S ribosomal protein S5 [Patescibacteria group bacterium]|nr:30S ribosomal protein S5 [Patescibacteria group bacterium]